MWRYAPHPVAVPDRLLDAFARLGAEAVLVGGSAVQVWVGRRDGIFTTGDLDFITALTVRELAEAGLAGAVVDGRHLVVEGVPIEFPSGPLAVGSHVFAPGEAAVPVPTLGGRSCLCLRPEASVLDRLAWVAGDRLELAYAQALAVAAVQAREPDWDGAWMARTAARARLGRLWAHLDRDLATGSPGPSGLAQALRIGWD